MNLNLRRRRHTTATGPTHSLSIPGQGRPIPRAHKVCPMCHGAGIVDHDALARDGDRRIKITKGQIASIRRLHAAGVSLRRIARLFPITHERVRQIISQYAEDNQS